MRLWWRIQISMAERVSSAVEEANSFREECQRVVCLVGVGRLKRMLQHLIDYIAAAHTLYDRLIVCVVAEVSKNLERALTLIRMCKRWTLLCPFVIDNFTTEFSRIFTLLESSIANLDWLLGLFDPYIGCATGDWNLSLSLPPIESMIRKREEQENHRGRRRNPSSGKASQRYIPPRGANCGAASALYILSDDQERVRAVMTGSGIPAIVHLLRASRIGVQTNLPVVRAVIDELLSVIKESEGPELQTLAVRSIGSLARNFPAGDIRVIESLVAQIRNKHSEVALEAVIALQKFVCEDNFLRSEHSQSIIKLNGVVALKRLIGKASQQAKVLLGYLYDSQTLQRYLCTDMEEKIGNARWTDMTPGNPANVFENLTISKASSIGSNMETKWPMPKSKTKFPNDLLRFAPVIGPCSCTCCGLLFILAGLNFIPNIQELSSWFSSSFATGPYGEYILKIVWRGISFEMLISW
ncbi:hypothetical protein SLEP1_g40837 [Rubroshorea leprosula]|uniref:DUF7792 domain-containing protein n=1 Tax=Rubroshorea leprosula TaxID=152421 RepID=A0AAV5L599_9ROSI|nr:hypothetical protein SLEP1_g40837 [Rubroshorea leprosula]